METDKLLTRVRHEVIRQPDPSGKVHSLPCCARVRSYCVPKAPAPTLHCAAPRTWTKSSFWKRRFMLNIVS